MTHKKSKKKKRISFKKGIKQNPKILWAYLGIALVVLYVLIYIVPSLNGALQPTYLAEYGQVEIGDETTIYVARDEQVYIAWNQGKLKTYAKEGEMIKKGSRISEITPFSNPDKEESISAKHQKIILQNSERTLVSKGEGICQKSGVFSVYIDGYEDLLSPKNMTNLTHEQLKKVSKKDIIEGAKGSVAKGAPLYKVVDNAKWYILCFLNDKDAKKYKEGSSCKVSIGKDDDATEIAVTTYKKVKKSGSETLVIFKTNRYYDEFAKLRTSKASIICRHTSGIMLKTSSIKEVDGKKGVYVKNTLGEFNFKPIKILAEKDDMTIVEKSYYYDEEGQYVETVSTYDQVRK